MKKINNFFYLLLQGIQNVFRNAAMSLASVVTLVSCMVIVGLLFLLLFNIKKSENSIEKLNIIVAYLEENTDSDSIDRVRAEIESIPNIINCKFISKEEALETLKTNSALDGSFIGTIENNPLPDAFEITYTNIDVAMGVVYNVEKIDGVSDVDNDISTVQSINSVFNGIMIAAIFLLVILVFVSFLIITNTIRLTVFARKKEIMIMRYVGSTKFYITMPFIIEGIFIALISVIVSLGLEFYLYQQGFMNTLGSFGIELAAFREGIPYLIAGFSAVGFSTAIIGSWFSVKKYSAE